MYAGLTSAYSFALLFGQGVQKDAERKRYADFLNEAALILNRSELNTASDQFKLAANAWAKLGETLLPDTIAPFAEARQLLDQKHKLFLTQGGGALVEIQGINGRLAQIRAAMADDFPLDSAGVTALREQIAGQVLEIRGIEETAVEALKQAMR